MHEWWSAQTAIWIGSLGGGGLGTLAGLFGAAVGLLAPRGLARGPVLATHLALVLIGAAMLLAGLLALVLGQPYHVYYPLGLIGLILTAVMGPLWPVVRARYRQAEARRLEAAQFRRG